MDTLNIGGNEKDRFYRYKMPKLISKIEGKGNGIKTVVPNMSDIARSLGRPPTYPTKFFGCELGAQVKCDEKNDRYIVNGAHEALKLQELLDVFIKKFVLCAGCNNPETDLIITSKSQKIIRDCKACGQRTDVDMRHKLVTFILKNPPTSAKAKSGKKDNKKASKKNGDAPESPTTPTKPEGSEEGSEDELTRNIKTAAAELPAADLTHDDDDWAVDTSPEAVRDRMKDLEGNINTSLVIGDDEDEEEEEKESQSGDDDDQQDPHFEFAKWLEENQALGNKEIYKKIKELRISKESDKIIETLVLGLFNESFQKDSAISKLIQKRAKLFKKFVQNADDQRVLLAATEILVGVKHKELLESRIICKILMEYYQAELVEEDVFQVWLEGKDSPNYQKLFKKEQSAGIQVDAEVSNDIRNKAKPFSKWLEEADEEDDDDDDD